MDKATGLIRLAPIIYGINKWICNYLCEVLLTDLEPLRAVDAGVEDIEAALDHVRHRRGSMTDEFGNVIVDGERRENEETEPLLDRAWKLLTHPSICNLEEGGLAEMRAAVLTMKTSSDKQALIDAHAAIEEACEEFGDHFYTRLPDHLLGEWGARLFRYLMRCDAEEARILADSLGSESAPTDLAVDLSVAIDDKTFSVQVGNRKPCSLGNSRQFKLLAHLVARPHRYVSFADLAVAIGSDELDRETVIVAKCRLCKKLAMQGYEDLAKLIVSQPDHYAFWPR